MKKNDELSSVELQRILLACRNITVSTRAINSQWNALSRSQWNALSRSQGNASLLGNTFPVRLLLSGTVFVVSSARDRKDGNFT